MTSLKPPLSTEPTPNPDAGAGQGLTETNVDTVTQLKDTLELITSKNSEQASEISRLVALVKAKTAEIESMKKNPPCASEVKRLKAALAKSDAERTKLKQQVVKSETEHAKLKKQVARSEAEHTRLKKQIAKGKAEHTRLKKQIAKGETERAKLQAQLAERDGERIKLNTQLTEHDGERIKLNAQLAETDSQADKSTPVKTGNEQPKSQVDSQTSSPLFSPAEISAYEAEFSKALAEALRIKPYRSAIVETDLHWKDTLPRVIPSGASPEFAHTCVQVFGSELASFMVCIFDTLFDPYDVSQQIMVARRRKGQTINNPTEEQWHTIIWMGILLFFKYVIERQEKVSIKTLVRIHRFLYANDMSLYLRGLKNSVKINPFIRCYVPEHQEIRDLYPYDARPQLDRVMYG